MSEIIKEIVNYAASILLPEITEKGKEAEDRKERIKAAKEALSEILEAEKRNDYYEALDKVLSNSSIIKDCLKRYLNGESQFDLSGRLNPVFELEGIPIEEKGAITGVIKKMLDCLKTIMLAPASGQETRIAARLEEIRGGVQEANDTAKQTEKNTQEIKELLKEQLVISLDEIEGYSEQVRDVSGLIPRRWVKEEDANEIAGIKTPDILSRGEKHIVLVNHAGFGKTIALNQLYAAANTSGKSAVRLSLKYYPGIPLFRDILKRKILDPEKVVLILDGYDEVKTKYLGQLDDALNQIAEGYPQITIVVSSRENFFENHGIGHFKRYRLAGLTDDDQRQYAQSRGIDAETFMEQIRSKNLTELSENAFYFAELIHLWEQNDELPDEAHVMKSIIESRLSADKGKFDIAASELERKVAPLHRAFERIAMVMQCTQRYSLTEAEVQRTVNDDLCEYMKLPGLWEADVAGQLSFSHNNFREYFAACWLNRHELEEILRFVAWNTGEKRIKRSWMNAFAFLAKLRNKCDLQKWIKEHDPEAIIAFEKERFSSRERLDLFTRMYDTFEEKQLWVTMDYQSLRKLGAFVSSKEAVDYILNRLSNNIESRQKQNLLRIMACFDSLYAEQNECSGIVSGIAFDCELPTSTRDDALDVMQAFPTVFTEYVSTAVRICMESAEEMYRYHLYQFIDSAGNLEDNFGVILHELEQPDNTDGSFNAGRSIFLEKKIATLQSPQAVADLMSFYIGHPARIDDRMAKIDWPHLFDVAIANNERKEYGFQSLVNQLYLICHKKFVHGVIDEIKRYMVATHAEKVFLDFIQSHDEIHNLLAVEELMCPSLGDALISYYERNALNDSELLQNIVTRYPEEDDTCRKLQRAIYLKTGNIITPRSYRKQEALRIEGKQKCFDALFSRSDFLALVKKLGLAIGMERPINDDTTLEILHSKIDEQEELLECYYILHNVFRKDGNTTISSAIEKIQEWNWDWFQYCMVSDKIGEKAAIKLSPSQKEWMETYTLRQLENIDLKQTEKLFIEQHTCYSWVYRVLSTMVKINMKSSLEFLKALLLVPAFLLDENNLYAFSPYLVEHIPQEEMQKQVIANIQQEDLRDCVAAAHLKYCTDHKLLGAKEFAIQFMCREDGKGYRYCALHYISEMYGAETIINEVVPLCEDDDFLRAVAPYVPVELEASVLDEKLDAAYERNPSRQWMEILIKRNHPNALEQYIQEAEEKNTLPDMTNGIEVPSLTRAIEFVLDAALLDKILRLLYLTTTPTFIDKRSFGLEHSCRKSVCHMASLNYDAVRKTLEQVKHNASGKYRQTCIDLIQQIDEEHQIQDDKGMNFAEALILMGA